MRTLGLFLLAVTVAAAAGAPFFAPHAGDSSFRSLLNAPPTLPHVRGDDGAWHAPFIYPWRLVNQLEQRYEQDRSSRVGLVWLSGGGLVQSSDDARVPLMLLGTDSYGRDVFSRLLFGARLSLGLAFVAAVGALLIGGAAGGLAGYAGGPIDDVLTRASDFVMVLPAMYVALALRSVLPLVLAPRTIFLLLAGIFAIVGAPFFSRGVRAIVRSEGRLDYAAAATSLGAGHARVLVRHLLPAARGFMVVQITMLVPAFIIAEATLSFVGLGFPDPMASWGTMLHDASNVRVFADFPWLLSPAAAMFLVVLALNLVLERSGGARLAIGGPVVQIRSMKLAGVFAPIPTPFDGDDRLDTKRLQAALAKWVAHPLAGFVVLGTTGEAQLLENDESDRAIAAAREIVPKDRPLIAGTGRESTSAAVAAAKRAADLGADAVLVRTPGVFKSQMTDDAFVRHHSAVADASTVPLILYNFPTLTGVRLNTTVVARLAAHPNIVGMKDSSGEVQQIARFVACAPGDFSVLTGSGSTFHTALSTGARGGILALSCVLPDACTRLFELTQAGLHPEARALQAQLLPIAKLVGSTYGVPALKAAAQLAGYDVGSPRPPLPPAPGHVVAELREALRLFEEVPAG